MTTTLITGATQGLGREAARRLAEAGHVVYVGARDADRGRAVADALGTRLLVLDVTDDRSVLRAADQLRAEVAWLDVLVNNAGVGRPARHADLMTAEDVRQVFETNVFGVVRVTRAFLPLLDAAPAPRIINVSSGLGSLTAASSPHGPVGPHLAYAASKTALNMLTVQYARAHPGIRVNAVNPGLTSTAINDFAGTQTVEQGTDAIVRTALDDDASGSTGTFTDARGPVAW